MNKKRIIYIIALFLVAYSCKKNSTTDADEKLKPIVTVKGETLYKGDLDQFIPIGVSGNDSTSMAQAYINKWISDILMYDKAKQNIVNENEINDLVADYRKSLIMNFYQEQLLKNYLSKSLSEKDLRAYYEANKDKLILKENIIKGLYLKIPKESTQLSNFQKWYKLQTDAAIENIEKNALQNTVGYEFFYDRWVNLDDVMINIPLQTESGQQFLKSRKSVEASDSSFVYLLNIKEYKLAGTEPPYEYIKSQLSEMYTESKRSEYLNKVQKDLYDKAMSNNDIKFYDK